METFHFFFFFALPISASRRLADMMDPTPKIDRGGGKIIFLFSRHTGYLKPNILLHKVPLRPLLADLQKQWNLTKCSLVPTLSNSVILPQLF